MFYYFEKSKNTTETKRFVWRRCCDWMCQNWFVKFWAGDFSLDNAPRLGRAAEVDCDQIETLLETVNVLPQRDCWHTQNIQINKVIGESEKCVLFYGKKPYVLSGQPNTNWYLFVKLLDCALKKLVYSQDINL